MECDFDKLRLNLAKAMNRLTLSVRNAEDSEDIFDAVEDLRLFVAGVLCLESDGGDVFKAIDFDLLFLGDEE